MLAGCLRQAPDKKHAKGSFQVSLGGCGKEREQVWRFGAKTEDQPQGQHRVWILACGCQQGDLCEPRPQPRHTISCLTHLLSLGYLLAPLHRHLSPVVFKDIPVL